MGTEYAGRSQRSGAGLHTDGELLQDARVRRQSIAVIIDYTETIVPVNEGIGQCRRPKHARVFVALESRPDVPECRLFVGDDDREPVGFEPSACTEPLYNGFEGRFAIDRGTFEFIRGYSTDDEFNSFAPFPWKSWPSRPPA